MRIKGNCYIFDKKLPNGFIESTEYIYNNKGGLHCIDVWQTDTKEKFQGPYLTYSPDGVLFRRYFYKDGKAEGLLESFYPNGKPWSRKELKNDKNNGLCESFYENGQLRERCYYKNDIKDGIEESYSPEGKLLKRRFYVKERKEICEQLEELNKLSPTPTRKAIKYQLVRGYRSIHQRG